MTPVQYIALEPVRNRQRNDEVTAFQPRIDGSSIQFDRRLELRRQQRIGDSAGKLRPIFSSKMAISTSVNAKAARMR